MWPCGRMQLHSAAHPACCMHGLLCVYELFHVGRSTQRGCTLIIRRIYVATDVLVANRQRAQRTIAMQQLQN